jgi:flagellar FliL protein
MQKILIIVNLVVALLAVGVVFYAHNLIKPLPTDQAAETEALKNDALTQSQLQPVSMKKIVVNLYSQGTRLRYLDVALNLLTFQEDQKEIIKSNEHVIKDSVVEVASQLAPDELDTVTGKILFEKRLKDKINEKLKQIDPSIDQPVIKQIFFSGFVVQ